MSGLGDVKRWSVYSAVGVSAVVSIYVGWLFSRNLEPNEHLFTLYRFVLVALFAAWLVADTREAGRSAPTFDYGAYSIFAFVVVAPYHLISTRRWRGVLIFGGMVLLLLLPALVVIAVAVYVS